MMPFLQKVPLKKTGTYGFHGNSLSLCSSLCLCLRKAVPEHRVAPVRRHSETDVGQTRTPSHVLLTGPTNNPSGASPWVTRNKGHQRQWRDTLHVLQVKLSTKNLTSSKTNFQKCQPNEDIPGETEHLSLTESLYMTFKEALRLRAGGTRQNSNSCDTTECC